MNHALDTSMFWVGAMFAFTPIIVGGAVIGIWWWMRKRGALDEDAGIQGAETGAREDGETARRQAVGRRR